VDYLFNIVCITAFSPHLIKNNAIIFVEMFSPIFSINNKILKNIGIIEGAKAIIDEAPLIPAYEKQFQQEAIVRTVHFGTRIEGNDLTFQEVAKLVEGRSITAGERDIQEVINYRNVGSYLEELWALLMPICLSRRKIQSQLFRKFRPSLFLQRDNHQKSPRPNYF
jgi:Fic family protein